MRHPLLNRLLPSLCLGACLTFALAAPGLTVTSGPAVTVGETTASLVWQTDVEAGTRVQYGTNEKQLDQRASGGVGTEHRVDLAGLQPGTQYFFSIGSARVLLGSGDFRTAGKSTVVADPNTPSVGRTVVQFLTGLVTPGASKKAADSAVVPPAPATVLNAPPTRQIWRQVDTLEDHYERHGADFKSVSKEHYASQAWLFLQRARQTALPMKWDDADDTLRVWEPKTRTFAAYDGRGKARTFFKPSNPDYWNRQPGRPLKPSELPFK